MMWLIADAWARSSGGHGGAQLHRGADVPADSDTGFALIVGAMLIWIGWLLIELFNIYSAKRGRSTVRATGRTAPSAAFDGRRLNDRMRSAKTEDE